MVVDNTIYTMNTVILHVICILSEKGPLGILCGIVKSRFTTDADAQTKKKPLIHSKVKTVGGVSPRTEKKWQLKWRDDVELINWPSSTKNLP